MLQSKYDLKSIIDLEKWHALQDSLSLVTQMAIITVDYKGVPVTRHSHCQSFCQAVRQDAGLSAYCQKCDARGGLEAVRLNKPYVYLCHFNILDIAIPITIDNQYVGAVMAGQVRLADNSASRLEQIVSRPASQESEGAFAALGEEYSQLPVMPYAQVATIAEMLSHLCNYIVEEASRKNEIMELYQQALGAPYVEAQPAKVQADWSFRHPAEAQEELSVTPAGSGAEPLAAAAVETIRSSNPILQPAFDYIFSHKHENFPLEAMAQLCHISPSYFSRLFVRESGENFSACVSRLKIGWAKQLLETTELSINQISDHLSFCDAGYFIKIFRKHEQRTPAAYRSFIRGD
ncbi:PocR ligand-binding domain-containing protein [Paenibacillus sp. S150]|uniref:PocR ligand-binding domain-containing protein n=1 Tax=Paenibacillus sp. S150 TaxID=2749826 RepID=UPI001C560C24|nr:PocR ligand-binding domain-containing protein [Paenibacillus sp. S150]MBW4082635.1 PocR ligand-binding domain-containing protein [Paenibacillus sp. S150]